MKISEKGLNLIKYEEGFSLKAYYDRGGNLTIGWGHCDNTMSPNHTITTYQAELLLMSDIKWVESALKGYDLNQNEYDALCSLVFNIGHGAFLQSTIRRRLIEGDFIGASKEFDKWIYSSKKDKKTGVIKKEIDPILVKRRAKEKNLFLTPCD